MFETNFLFETPIGKELEIEISRITNQKQLGEYFSKSVRSLGGRSNF